LLAVDLDVILEQTAALEPFRHIGVATFRIRLMRTCKPNDKRPSSCADMPLSLHFRYGSHPIYLEHRYNATTGKASSSGVLLLRYVSYQFTLFSSVTVLQRRRFGYLPANAQKFQGVIDRVPYDWWYPRFLLFFGSNGCRSYCTVWLSHRIPYVATSVGFRFPSLQVMLSATCLT